MIEHCRQVFLEESDELLAELEIALLELEKSPAESSLVDRIFRALHTIKGSSSMFGYDGVASFSHEMETVFDLVRDGGISVSRDLVALTLQARDLLKEMLLLPVGSSAGLEGRVRHIIDSFRMMVPAEAGVALPEPDTGASVPAALTSFRIRYSPGRDTFRMGANPVHLFSELRMLGNCRVRALTEAIPALEELEPTCCYLSWEIELATECGLDAIRDVFIFSDDDEVEIELLETVANEEGAAAGLAAFDVSVAASGEAVTEGPVYEAISSIRVSAGKLDSLVNLVGELVTVQARLTRTAAGRDDHNLLALAEELERLTGDLRDNTLSIRMLPIGSTFSRLRRLVHDLAGELGKEIELVAEGGETELDKTVIEKLADPLVHLIRNCIDHGIETPAVREAAGKSGPGRLRLTAIHSGDCVQISISDDGKGIDREVLRKRAMERGVIPAGAELSDTELLNLIFTPGLSTADLITSVSGRGVGMDVVRKGVDLLRGSVTVASTKGAGTTFTLRIPLTLAIIESLLVRVGSDCYVLPLSLVEECIELSREDIARSNGRHLVNVRGMIVPYIPLRQRFGVKDRAPDREQVVITEVEGKRVGLVVDQVIGEHQTVIKSLGRVFRDVAGLSGATILGDGTVALILDVPQIVHAEELVECAA